MSPTLVSLNLSHINDVLEIENDSFLKPWKLTDFINVCKLQCSDNVVLMLGDVLVGYAFAELEHDRVYLSNLAVRDEYRRKGYASLILDYYKIRLNQSNRDVLYATVRESDLRLQMFFKKNDFWYIESLRGLCDTNEDTYVFEYVKRMKV